jgi:hypothetical protein
VVGAGELPQSHRCFTARGAQNAPRPFFTEFHVLTLPARLKSLQQIAYPLLLVLIGCASPAQAAGQGATRSPQASAEVTRCLRAAAHKFQLDPRLLKAIAGVESNFNPRAVNAANANGTRDVGLMQINSTWLPTLRRWNITEQDLFNPCTNAEVGAWVLASNFSNMGPSWDAVGAYNASSPHKRRAYAWKVYRAYQQHQQLPAADMTGRSAHAGGEGLAMRDVAHARADAAQSSLIQINDRVAALTGGGGQP